MDRRNISSCSDSFVPHTSQKKACVGHPRICGRHPGSQWYTEIMAKYLVTGCAGFIGSSLVDALVKRGESVRGLDNFETGKRENLAGVLDQMELLEADLRDADAMVKACEGVDYIFHTAAVASVPRSVKDPRTSHT